MLTLNGLQVEILACEGFDGDLDMCDVYISEAQYSDSGIELTSDEIEQLETENPSIAQEWCFDNLDSLVSEFSDGYDLER